jgi:hypothetical protein
MRRALLSLYIACGALLASCPGKPQSLLPPDYPSWELATKVELNYPIPGHEDHYRIDRVNSLGYSYRPAASAAGNLSYDYPEGTIFAKEVYQGIGDPEAGAKPFQITFAVKAPKDPGSRGGWIWVVKDVATGAETVVTGSFCEDCHANANEAHPYGDKNPKAEFRDFIFFPPAY